MFLLITILLIAAVAPPSAQGQFPRACINRSSLKNRDCCPVPQGFTAPCGSDGNRGKCHEFTVRRWNVTYSHFKEFQKEDDRSLWPNPLYTTECANAMRTLVVTTAVTVNSAIMAQIVHVTKRQS